MPYYNKKEYKLIGYQRSNTAHKMYDAILENKKTKKTIKVPFGDKRYQNYRDLTGLNLYPKLIHNNPGRRKLYRARHYKDLKLGYYNPGWFSYYILW